MSKKLIMLLVTLMVASLLASACQPETVIETVVVEETVVETVVVEETVVETVEVEVPA